MSAKIALTALVVTTVFATSIASSLAGKEDMGGDWVATRATVTKVEFSCGAT